jgi:hypothetical protein
MTESKARFSKTPEESPLAEFTPPAFDSIGLPLIDLNDLQHQWNRLPFVQLETSFRWDSSSKRRKPVRRVVLPYDSLVEPNPVRYLFRKLLKSPELKTGILYDACPIPKPLRSPHPKQRVERQSDIKSLTALVRQLSAGADVDRNPFVDFDRVINEARLFYYQYGVLPIVVIDVNVERLHPEARAALALDHVGALQLRTDKPAFEQTNLFAVAPLVKELGHTEVKLVVDEKFVLTNRRMPDFYEVSLDGKPVMHQRLGAAIVFDFEEAQQITEITIGIGRSDTGVVQTAQFRLESTLVPNYDLIWVPSCHPVGSEGEDVWIRPYVFFGANHDTSPGAPEIQNPFVILGGYDQELFGNYSLMYAAIADLVPGVDLMQLLRNDFDVILLEYSDVGVSLELNAQALACVIVDINNRNEYRDGIVFLGISMGGLVSRMAFAGMENNAIPGITDSHNVRVWATIDTPHQGAHIPLGLQFLADHFSWIPTEEVDRVNALLNSTSAKEMLIEHHETPDAVSPERRRHLAALRNWGSFPRNIGTTIAMASGSLAYPYRVYQNYHHVPPDCPDLGLGSGCISIPEQWLSFWDNIESVQEDENVFYLPQDNRKGLGGLGILSVHMEVYFLGLSGWLSLLASARTVQARADDSETKVFGSYWSFDIVPGWLLSFIDNPSGTSERRLRYGNPYSLMAGGWLSTSQDIFDALASIELAEVSFPPDTYPVRMPRHTFVPIWSALDVSETYLRVMYDWLTKYGPATTVWETWYGANYLGGSALDRGEFSYEDFVDFDKIIVAFNSPNFNGRVRESNLGYAGTMVTVRPSPFDWVYFNRSNMRHGQIDAGGIRFLLDRITEALGGTPSTSPASGYASIDGHYALMEAAPTTADPLNMLSALSSYVEDLGLLQTTEQGLLSTLQAAHQAIANNDSIAAITSLETFINNVDALRGGELTDEQADLLNDVARRIISLLM